MSFVSHISIFMNHLKSLAFCFKEIFFFFFCEYVRMEKLKYKNENIERKFAKEPVFKGKE